MSETITGAGPVVERPIEGSRFTKVILNIPAVANISQEDVFSLVISAQENLFPYLRTDIQHNQLTLSVAEGCILEPTEPIIVNIGMKRIQAVTLSATGKINVGDVADEQFNVSLTGSGEIVLDSLTVEKLVVHGTGDGKVTCQSVYPSGSLDIVQQVGGTVAVVLGSSEQANTMEIHHQGSADLDLGNLETEEVTVSLSGSGSATVWASEVLKAEISGTGNVRYYGDPTVKAGGAGSGKTQSLGLAPET